MDDLYSFVGIKTFVRTPICLKYYCDIVRISSLLQLRITIGVRSICSCIETITREQTLYNLNTSEKSLSIATAIRIFQNYYLV